jgi:hypothetical protein
MRARRLRRELYYRLKKLHEVRPPGTCNSTIALSLLKIKGQARACPFSFTNQRPLPGGAVVGWEDLLLVVLAGDSVGAEGAR